jgi:hypothetical protein
MKQLAFMPECQLPSVVKDHQFQPRDPNTA